MQFSKLSKGEKQGVFFDPELIFVSFIISETHK